MNITDNYDNSVTYIILWEILRLKEQELWVKELLGTDSYEYHFIPFRHK